MLMSRNKSKRGRTPADKMEITTEQILSFDTAATHEIIDSVNRFTRPKFDNKISTTQVRKIFNLIRSNEAKNAPILRAKLAYIKARTDNKHENTKRLLDMLDECLQEIKSDDKAEYDNLIKFLETVVSFQRLNGDSNS